MSGQKMSGSKPWRKPALSDRVKPSEAGIPPKLGLLGWGFSLEVEEIAAEAVRRHHGAVISQTTPQPGLQLPWPPNSAVPHKLPVASRVTGPMGVLPSLPLKSCRSVSVQLPLEFVSLKINPAPLALPPLLPTPLTP